MGDPIRRESPAARTTAAIRGGDLGTGAGAIESMRVTLHESHLAAAAFDGRV